MLKILGLMIKQLWPKCILRSIYWPKLLSALLCAQMLWPQATMAQLVFDTATTIRVASAPDYAREVLNNPWDMNDGHDLADYIPDADIGAGITNRSFSNGQFSFTVPGADNAYFHLLSPGQCGTNAIGKTGQVHPIDTTKYRYLTIRMNTTVASELRVIWYTSCNYSSHFARTAPIATSVGWNTYTIDLATATIETNSGVSGGWSGGPATGLRIEPGYSGNFSIDSIMLTSAISGGTAAIAHTFTPNGNDRRFSLYLDDNNNPFDGYVSQLEKNLAAAPSLVLGGQNIFPGTYQLVGYGSDDYATLQGDPWDMNSSSDMWISSGLTSLSFSGGQLSGTTSNTDPYIYFSSFSAPIDTSIYRYISIKMTLTAGGGGAIGWGSTSGALSGQHYFTALAGTHVYNFDVAGLTGWNGNIGRLRLVLGNTSGNNFSIDFVSLRQTQFVASLDNPTVVSHAGGFIVNQPPAIDVLEPNARGGEDFASTVLGNPWNFDGTTDLVSVYALSLAEILPNNYVNGVQGDFFHGRNVSGNPDPYQTSLSLASTSGQRIDTSRYKNLAYKAYIAATQDVTNGSVARIIWQSAADGDATPRNGDDQITHDGWNEYLQDMTAITLEEVIHPPGSFANPVWHGLANMFRIDIHEFTPSTDYYIDYIHMTADDEANTKFAITYDGLDGDNLSSDVQLSLYYTTSKQASGGALITGGLSYNDDTRVYEWDTTSIPANTYYIYGVANDGLNSTARLASGRLKIDHNRAQNASAPVLSLSYPANSGNIYNSTILSGYAIDDIKIATIEVLVDGNLITTIHPSLFSKPARTAYPSYPWSSNAGFFSAVDFSSVALGSHSLEVKAWDTAGNHTSTILSITKQAGSDPSPPSAPAQESEGAVSIPTVPSVQAKFSVKQNNGASQIVTTVQNTAGCATLKIVGSNASTTISSNPLAASVIKTLTGATKKQSFTAAKVKALKPKSTVYYGLTCNDNYLPGTLKSGKPFQLSSKSKVGSVGGWFSQFGKKLKVTKKAAKRR